MTIHPHALAAFLEEFTRGYPTGKPEAGLLGSVARRENGGRAILSPSRPDARLVSISGGNDPNPYVVSITLYRKNLSDVPPNSNHLPQARIAWGAGKGAQTALVDFQHGARITLDCSSLTVDALYSSVGSPVVGPEIECFAGVVYGSLGSQLNTLTLGVQSIPAVGAPFAGVPTTVPDFASEVKIYSDDSGSTFDLILGRNIVAGRVVPESVVSVAPNQWVQIPNGMEFLDIERTAGVATTAGPQYLLNL
jgi:hypothetical protein